MTRESAIREFLKKLRIASINAGVYQIDHPVFRKSIQHLKLELNRIFFKTSRIDIGIKPDSLIVAGIDFKGERLYKELAGFFHVRKIKNIVIESGITELEFGLFLSDISISPGHIDEQGGITNIMKSKKYTNIKAEELDYTGLLAVKKGRASEDIWKFLLNDLSSVDESNDADSFIRDLRRGLKETDFSDMQGNLPVLRKLKDTISFSNPKWPQMGECIKKELLSSLLRRGKAIKDDVVLEEMKNIFENFGDSNIVDTLWEEVFENDNFSPFVFSLFNQLTNKDREREIAFSWNDKLEKQSGAINIPLMKDKVKELMILDNTDMFLPPIYKDTLSFLAKMIKESDKMVFDQVCIFINYFHVMLNVFIWEKNPDSIKYNLELMFKDQDKLIGFLDFISFRAFLTAVDEKIEQIDQPSLGKLLQEKRESIVVAVERLILEENSKIGEDEFNYFLKAIKKSNFDARIYLEKIWISRNNMKHLLRMFYEFFPWEFSSLRKKLQKEFSNGLFLKRMMESLGEIDTPWAFRLLKEMFDFSGLFIKAEVLKTIGMSSFMDENFVLLNLKTKDIAIRKEALKIIKNKDTDLRTKAAEILLNICTPFGIANKFLIENVKLIGEVEITEGEDLLRRLLKRRFLWPRKEIRKEINLSLEMLRR